MSGRFFRDSALTVLVILALLVPLPAMAVDPPASSKDSAGAPLSDWVSIGPGETQWYRFKYHSDFDPSDEKHDPTQALVILKAGDDSRAVNFMVQTPQTLALPKYDEDGHVNNPLGVGSPLTDDDGDVLNWLTFLWAGSAEAKETFYVIVKNSGTSMKTYKLSITGPDVSF